MRIEVENYPADRTEPVKQTIDNTSFQLFEVGRHQALLTAIFRDNQPQIALIFNPTELVALDSSTITLLTPTDFEGVTTNYKYLKLAPNQRVFLRYSYDGANLEAEQIHFTVPLLAINIVP